MGSPLETAFKKLRTIRASIYGGDKRSLFASDSSDAQFKLRSYFHYLRGGWYVKFPLRSCPQLFQLAFQTQSTLFNACHSHLPQKVCAFICLLFPGSNSDVSQRPSEPDSAQQRKSTRNRAVQWVIVLIFLMSHFDLSLLQRSIFWSWRRWSVRHFSNPYASQEEGQYRGQVVNFMHSILKHAYDWQYCSTMNEPNGLDTLPVLTPQKKRGRPAR